MAKSSSKIEEVFRLFDNDKDGKISASELQLCMARVGGELSAEDAEELVASVDSDGDGLLELEELEKLMEAEEEEKSGDLRAAFEMYEMEGEGCITARSLKRMLSRLGASRGFFFCCFFTSQANRQPILKSIHHRSLASFFFIFFLMPLISSTSLISLSRVFYSFLWPLSVEPFLRNIITRERVSDQQRLACRSSSLGTGKEW